MGSEMCIRDSPSTPEVTCEVNDPLAENIELECAEPVESVLADDGLVVIDDSNIESVLNDFL